MDDAVAATATSYVDLGMVRGVYYYEVVAIDAVGLSGPLAAANDRATSYFLGDFDADALVQGTGDLTVLGTAFGTQPGDDYWNNEADIGPTDTHLRLGIPTTDNIVNFEDLMIFALNYGVVSKTGTLPRSPARFAWRGDRSASRPGLCTWSSRAPGCRESACVQRPRC